MDFICITALKRNQIDLYVDLHMELDVKMIAEFYPHQIRAKITSQRSISVEMRYEFNRGQNRDPYGSYVGGIWA